VGLWTRGTSVRRRAAAATRRFPDVRRRSTCGHRRVIQHDVCGRAAAPDDAGRPERQLQRAARAPAEITNPPGRHRKRHPQLLATKATGGQHEPALEVAAGDERTELGGHEPRQFGADLFEPGEEVGKCRRTRATTGPWMGHIACRRPQRAMSPPPPGGRRANARSRASRGGAGTYVGLLSYPECRSPTQTTAARRRPG